jgi:pyruvate formate lyase activating enzyme
MGKVVSGRIYDIQRFSVHDGPGIRTEVFLKGCPLRCLWCHSPESQSFHIEVGWFEVRCIGVEVCGRCLEACPNEALAKGRVVESAVHKREVGLVNRDMSLCSHCGTCVEVCPASAFVFLGRDVTVDEVMHVVEQDRPFYRRSGGGVTISGGEPLGQPSFLRALLLACRERKLHTCLDTTGFARWEVLKDLLPLIDLVLLDIKHMDSTESVALVGVPNDLTLENARKIAAEGTALQVRIPVIPGLNDSDQNIQATSEFCVELGSSLKIVQILPYHRLGTAKYERLQKEYSLKDLLPPDDARMESIRTMIESYGLRVRIE